MTEEQQLEWALRMSMQEGTGAASSGALQTASPNTGVSDQLATTEISTMEIASTTPKEDQSSTAEAMEVDDSAAARDAMMVIFFFRKIFYILKYHATVLHVIFKSLK